ncbi:MAG: M48 family metallopeptidase [Oxalobacter sp.]|jgi:Zn-dependent protease with chaperone function|nr:M48 family metallopeptidase [Oxalobacter sp.]MBR6001121.1 M48 family metallopeptidase [Oxalobacter sp.]
MKKWFTRTALAAACLAALCGCQTTTSGGATGSDRSQMMLISSEEMNKQSTQAYNSLLAKARNAHALNTNRAYTQRVVNISRRLINQVGVFRKDALHWKWEVNVLSSKTVNAFCMPGGKIAVYTGLIDSLNLTDGELAAVIGHEICHALREHSREQASQQAASSIPTALVGAFIGSSELASGMNKVFFSLPFSRTMETEADTMGMELMARAGYDPHEAVNVWRKMEKLKGGSSSDILSTHPSDAKRIENLESHLPEVMPLYEAALSKGTKTRTRYRRR